jgi:hypothetical protein
MAIRDARYRDAAVALARSTDANAEGIARAENTTMSPRVNSVSMSVWPSEPDTTTGGREDRMPPQAHVVAVESVSESASDRLARLLTSRLAACTIASARPCDPYAQE